MDLGSLALVGYCGNVYGAKVLESDFLILVCFTAQLDQLLCGVLTEKVC